MLQTFGSLHRFMLNNKNCLAHHPHYFVIEISEAKGSRAVKFQLLIKTEASILYKAHLVPKL